MLLMLTLTAPGDSEHYLPSGELCLCTPAEGIDCAWWNATAGQRWSWFVTYLRREYGDVQFGKAVELQQRGAIHHHVLLRVRPSTGMRMLREVATIRAMAIARGYGHSLTLEACRSEGAAGYCAKYVSKACDRRYDFPWLDLRTGEVLPGAPRFRPWSTSRKWGATMKGLRASERLFAMLRERQGDGDGKRSEAPAPLDSVPANYTLSAASVGSDLPAAGAQGLM